MSVTWMAVASVIVLVEKLAPPGIPGIPQTPWTKEQHG
jgi:hypothetical protein